MLKFRKVAVTGTIASGKTTVCQLFKELGAYVVSADEIVHQLLSPDTDIGKKVITLLGKDVVINGRFSRKAIANKVFCDERLLLALEELLHPEVQKEIEVKYRENFQKYSLFVAEVPLLFESDLQDFYDTTIAVTADEERCKRRFIETTSYDEAEFMRRVERLVALEQKAKMADLTIENNGSLEELRASVKKVYTILVQES